MMGEFITTSLYHVSLVVAILVVGVASYGLGQRLFVWSGLRDSLQTSWSKPLAYFLGQVLISVAMGVTSFLLALPFNLVVMGVILAIGVFFSNCWQWNWKNTGKNFLKTEWSNKILLFLIAVPLIFTSVYAFHRPSEWDEVAYHFPVMKEISQGSMRFPLLQQSPYNGFYQPFSVFYGSLPYGSESYSAVVYLISGGHASAAHATVMLNFVVFLCFAGFFVRDVYKVEVSSVLAVSLLLVINHGLLTLLSTGLVDINVMIYQFLGLALIIFARKYDQKKLLLLSALCIGFAFGQKFTTAFLLPVYLFFSWMSLSKKERSFSFLLQYGLFMAVGSGIWYFKNIFLHFNPIYPLYLGHRGMTETEYAFLFETLIESLKAPLTVTHFVKTFWLHYNHEMSTLLAVSLVLFGFIFKKNRLTWTTGVLITSACFFYAMNFIFGSQLSRYVLLVPFIFHLLLAVVLNKRRALTLFIVFASLYTVKLDPVQKIVWKARLQELPQVFAVDHTLSDASKLGCVADVYQYCKNHCTTPRSVLNLWDAYGAVYYEDTQLYYTLPSATSFDSLTLPETVTHLYINSQISDSFTASPQAHRDMQPKKRQEFESQLTQGKTPIFASGACQLYEL